MDDPEGLKDWNTYISVDPFTQKLQVVSEDWPILRFKNIADLRTYCCLPLAEANRLETHLSSLEKLRKKPKTVGKHWELTYRPIFQRLGRDAIFQAHICVDQGLLKSRPRYRGDLRDGR
jgi:hypothetical protein